MRIAYAAVNVLGVHDPDRSSGVNDISVTGTASNVFCFDLAFTPKIAVASPFINNAGWVATWTPGDNSGPSCPEGYRDAAVRTFASTGADEAFGFKIIFL